MCGKVSSLSDNELTVGNSELDMWRIVWGLPRGLGKGHAEGRESGPWGPETGIARNACRITGEFVIIDL